jgi:hypothetical protein
MTRRSLLRFENFCVKSSCWQLSAKCTFLVLRFAVGMSKSATGQVDGSLVIHSGPFHHNVDVASVFCWSDVQACLLNAVCFIRGCSRSRVDADSYTVVPFVTLWVALMHSGAVCYTVACCTSLVENWCPPWFFIRLYTVVPFVTLWVVLRHSSAVCYTVALYSTSLICCTCAHGAVSEQADCCTSLMFTCNNVWCHLLHTCSEQICDLVNGCKHV